MTPPTAYPNLGFDPCPGSPDSISTLQQRISTAATTMKQANDLIHKLRDDQSGIWRGMAGHAFRSHLSITLIDDLASANQAETGRARPACPGREYRVPGVAA